MVTLEYIVASSTVLEEILKVLSGASFQNPLILMLADTPHRLIITLPSCNVLHENIQSSFTEFIQRRSRNHAQHQPQPPLHVSFINRGNISEHLAAIVETNTDETPSISFPSPKEDPYRPDMVEEFYARWKPDWKKHQGPLTTL